MAKIPRSTYRTFSVAPGSAQVIAICGKGKILRTAFQQINDQKIAVVLTEDDELNADKIAFSDEVVILNESEKLNDFEKKTAQIADAFLKPVSILTPVNQESEEKTNDEHETRHQN